MKKLSTKLHSIDSQIVNTRLIPGSLNEINDGSIDWSYHGLIAYGCQNSIIIVDYRNLEIVQTLSIHSDFVTKLAWKLPDVESSLNQREDSLNLISGDNSGSLIISNVQTKKIIASCIKFSGPVKDIKWVSFLHDKNSFVLVLFKPDTVALFSFSGLCLCWRLKYSQPLLSISIHKNDYSLLSINTYQSIHIYNDFCFWDQPKSLYKKINIAENPNTVNLSVETGSFTSETEIPLKPKQSLLSSATNVFKNLQSKSDRNSPVDFLNENNVFHFKACEFLPYYGMIILIVTQNSVAVYNAESEQILTKFNIHSEVKSFHVFNLSDSFVIATNHNFSIFSCKKENVNSPAFQKCSSVDVIFDDNSPTDNSNETYVYHRVAGVDPIRIGRQTNYSGFAFNPVTEAEFVYITRYGVLFIYHLPFISLVNQIPSLPLPLHYSFKKFSNQFQDDQSKNMHKFADLRCVQRSTLYNVHYLPTCIRVSPPITTTPHRSYRLYAVIGFKDGSLQVFNLPFGALRRHYTLFSMSIKQIEWLTYNTIIALATDKQTGKYELVVLDVQTGDAIPIKSSTKVTHDCLKSIQVSETRNYILMSFNSGLVQLWDAIELKFIQNLLGSTAIIEALNWKVEDCTASNEAMIEHRTAHDELDAIFPSVTKPTYQKEKLYIIDNKMNIREFYVEGNLIQENNSMENDFSVSSISCMANKGNLVMLADSEASIAMIDLKKNTSSLYQNKGQNIRGIKFGPYIGNPLVAVMFNDSFQVWNSATLSIIYDSKRYTESSFLEIDWISSNLLLALYRNGSIEIIDILKSPHKPAPPQLYHRKSFTTFFLPHSVQNTLKYLLFHIPHEALRDHDFSLTRFFTDELPIEQRNLIIESFNKIKRNYANQMNIDRLSEKALIINRFFGDEFDIEFWKIADYYLKFYSHKYRTIYRSNLEIGYMSICDPKHLRDFFRWLILHEKNTYSNDPNNHEAEKYIIKWLIYIQEMNALSKMLINSDPNSPLFYYNVLKSLAIENTKNSKKIDSSLRHQTTSKLLSMNKLQEAVEFMLLTGSYQDVCTTLIDNNQNFLAKILSKLLLNENEMNNFTNYMFKKSSETKSWKYLNDQVLFMVSANRFDIAIKTLFEFGRTDLAALLKQCCDDYNIEVKLDLLSKDNINDIFFDCLNEKYTGFLRSIHIKRESLIRPKMIEE